MVIKGSARGAPTELAAHLQRVDTNEKANVLAMWGVASTTLADALHELDALGAGARSRRTLYHAQINSREDELLNEIQRRRSVARLSEELGLAGQPYVLVEHVKKGRQHFHVVWSRINLDTMTAIPDSHNYRKHELVARELEREFEHQRVQGVHVERDGKPRPPRTPALSEMRQADRSGMTPQQAKELVTECWRQTSTGHEFMRRLETAGFLLARGDRRDFVLIDHAGEVHGLTRRIAGAKAADIRERMADLDVTGLPTADQAREIVRQRARATPEPEVEKGFVSSIERQRADDLSEQGRALPPRLPHADQEIAAALWKLNHTMRGELDGLILGNPETLSQPKVMTPAAIPPAPEGSPRLEAPAQAQVPKPPARVVADHSPEVPQRPSHEAEIPALMPKSPSKPEFEEKPRPSASLFVRVFSRLSEAYHRAFARAQQPPTPGEPPLPPPRKPDPLREVVPVPPVQEQPAPTRRETLREKLDRETTERDNIIGNVPPPPQQTLRRILERRLQRDPDDPEP